METYEYEPLHGERAIRLLYLQPGVNREIVIELNEISLDEQPIFEALSYTWHTPEYDGLSKETIVDDKPTEWIVCAGQHICITPNCKNALFTIRRSDIVRVLWVDAICINQKDIPERNQQVILMENVYSACTRVLCWIGMANDHTAVVFNYINLFVRQREDAIRLFEQQKDQHANLEYESAVSTFKETRSAISGSFFDARFTPLWYGFASLHQRSYWDRVWVLQEIKAAPEALLLCGRHEINYLDLDAFMETNILLDANAKEHDPAWQKYKRSWAQEFLSKFIHQSLIVTDSHNRSALETLIDGAQFLSTDPRDKVFALIGISRELRELVPAPDYSLSTSEVYTKVAAAILDRTKSLDILYFCFGQACEPGLPSWVPDWNTAERPWWNSQREAAKRCNAAKGLPVFFEVHPLDFTLKVKCILVDTVDVVAEHYDAEINNLASSMREQQPRGLWDQNSFLDYPYGIWKQWCQISKSCCYQSRRAGNGTDSDPLWCLFDLVLRQPDLHHGYKGWRVILNDEKLSLAQYAEWIFKFAHIRAFDKAATSGTAGFTLCTTTDRRLALVPEVVQTRDKVVVIAGCSLPFIVRPISDGYKLIGASYVHGINEGEATADDMKELVTIVLRGTTDVR